MLDERVLYYGPGTLGGRNDVGYPVSQPLQAYLQEYSPSNISHAITYVLGRKEYYSQHMEDGLYECMVIVSAIFERLGNNNTYRYYQRQDGKYIRAAQELELLTDSVLVFWSDRTVSDDARLRMQTNLRIDALSKKMVSAFVQHMKGAGDHGPVEPTSPEGPSASISEAKRNAPLEMMVYVDMFERLQFVDKDSGLPVDVQRELIRRALGTSGSLKELFRGSAYERYMAWERGGGFRWDIYDEPPPQLDPLQFVSVAHVDGEVVSIDYGDGVVVDTVSIASPKETGTAVAATKSAQTQSQYATPDAGQASAKPGSTVYTTRNLIIALVVVVVVVPCACSLLALILSAFAS